MRRPFLEIREIENRLIKTNDKKAHNDFSNAVKAANSLLLHYKESAQYNPELLNSVNELSKGYEIWIASEQHLFSDYKDASSNKNLLIKANISLMRRPLQYRFFKDHEQTWGWGDSYSQGY